MTGLVAGVDVGGTFTDLVIFDPATGAVRLAKVPTTLPNQSGGVLEAFATAGAALGDIDRVSRRLAELIEQISSQALREAESANVVVSNIQHIFAVTEQTGEGTRSTTQLVRELSKTAEELQQSVSRFKIES